MKKVKWGVLSTAKIGINKVIPALQKSDLIEVVAIASRSLEAAQKAAANLGIEKAYGTYEALFNDPNVEVIYNPLPNHLHVPMTLAAARAGKHVLCEKPMALTAPNLDQLSDVAQHVHIMEGFMVRHSSQWLEARRRLRDGEIGPVQMIQSYFTYNNPDPNNIRNKADIGGGGLMDIGCYPIVAGRFFFEAEPLRVMALITRHAEFGTDSLTSGLLDFGQGRHLNFAVSTQLAGGQTVSLMGPQGRITLPIPFNGLVDAPNRLIVDDGKALGGANAVAHDIATSDQYQQMGEAFSRAVRGEIPLPYGLDDARANMRIIDALFRSETSGHWEMV